MSDKHAPFSFLNPFIDEERMLKHGLSEGERFAQNFLTEDFCMEDGQKAKSGIFRLGPNFFVRLYAVNLAEGARYFMTLYNADEKGMLHDISGALPHSSGYMAPQKTGKVTVHDLVCFLKEQCGFFRKENESINRRTLPMNPADEIDIRFLHALKDIAGLIGPPDEMGGGMRSKKRAKVKKPSDPKPR